MNLPKINWKIFFKNPEVANPDDFFRAFNSWIPNSPEVFIDVADYKHVHDGPLTVLVGHYVTYSLDSSGRRLGLLYSRNRSPDGSVVGLAESFAELVKAAKRVEEDKSLGGLRFATNEFVFIVNDRAACPNNDESFKTVKPALDSLFGGLFVKEGYALSKNPDPKQRFQMTIAGNKSPSLSEILSRL